MMVVERTLPVLLNGPGLEADDLTRISALTGLAPLVGKGADPECPVVDLIREGEVEALGDALRGTAVAVVEHLAGAVFPDAALARALAGNSLYISLSTRTAWSLDTAAAVADGLIARAMMPDYLRHDVELSLHEAVINAVLHGNLGLGSTLVDDPAAFDTFCRRLTQTLELPERACKRVEVEAWRTDTQIWVRISDQGDGYDPATVVPATLQAKSGRGLVIMRQLSAGMEVTDGGRTVILGFAV